MAGQVREGGDEGRKKDRTHIGKRVAKAGEKRVLHMESRMPGRHIIVDKHALRRKFARGNKI